MGIQPPGTITQAFVPPINGDTLGRRNSAPSSDGVTPPVATQTQQAVPQTKPAGEASSGAVNKETLEKSLSKINEFVQARASNVEFMIDKDTGIHVVKVVDTSTKETIRQFPSEEVVDIAKALDHLQGLLIRNKA